MAQPSGVAAALTTVMFAAVLAGCGGETTSTVATTTIASSSTTSQAPATSTTSLVEGPQPFATGSLLEPGAYVTTVFEPTVMYQIERIHLLRAFQNERITGLENRPNYVITDDVSVPYRGVSVQNFWHGLTPDEVRQKLEQFEQIDLGNSTAIEIGGFPGRRIEATVQNRVGLWATLAGGDQGRSWNVQPGPLVFIILETPPERCSSRSTHEPRSGTSFSRLPKRSLPGSPSPTSSNHAAQIAHIGTYALVGFLRDASSSQPTV